MIVETMIERLAQTRYVKPVRYSSAMGLTAEVYRQMQADFLPIPLLTLHSPVPEVLAGVWSILRETLLAGAVDRAQKEVVAAVVSKTNECPFCVDAHRLMLEATAGSSCGGRDYAWRLRSHPRPAAARDGSLGINQADSHYERSPASAIFARRGPAFIGTAIAFHYINRMVNVFLGDTLLPVPPTLRGVAGTCGGATAGKWMVRPLQPGSSLRLVPRAELPDDLFWAAADPAVAGAFAGFAAVVEQAGSAVLLYPSRCVPWSVRGSGVGRRSDGSQPALGGRSRR